MRRGWGASWCVPRLGDPWLCLGHCWVKAATEIVTARRHLGRLRRHHLPGRRAFLRLLARPSWRAWFLVVFKACTKGSRSAHTKTCRGRDSRPVPAALPHSYNPQLPKQLLRGRTSFRGTGVLVNGNAVGWRRPAVGLRPAVFTFGNVVRPLGVPTPHQGAHSWKALGCWRWRQIRALRGGKLVVFVCGIDERQLSNRHEFSFRSRAELSTARPAVHPLRRMEPRIEGLDHVLDARPLLLAGRWPGHELSSVAGPSARKPLPAGLGLGLGIVSEAIHRWIPLLIRVSGRLSCGGHPRC